MKKTFTDNLRLYYRLSKPGIIYGNLITAAGGFLFASKGNVDVGLLLVTFAGISLVIASACVFNNVIDRNIDRKMARTSGRAVAAGLISAPKAVAYGFVIGLIGIIVLAVYTNSLTLGLGIAALFSYVILYGLAKRHSVHGTLVGTVPGAAPIVAGYVAVTNRLDEAALILFLILVFWQMAHFYAIAIYRLSDYKAAGIPVLPAKKGVYVTKAYMLIYIVAFIAAVLLLSSYGHSSYSFGGVMALFGVVWLALGIQGFGASNDKFWARRMFKFSLLVIMGMSVMLSLDSMLQ